MRLGAGGGNFESLGMLQYMRLLGDTVTQDYHQAQYLKMKNAKLKKRRCKRHLASCSRMQTFTIELIFIL